jgi:hypothetical protein
VRVGKKYDRAHPRRHCRFVPASTGDRYLDTQRAGDVSDVGGVCGIIRERVKSGIARVKQTGSTKSGKPIGRPTVRQKVADAVRSSLAAGVSIRKTAAETGASISSVQRIKAAMVSAQ